MEVHRAQRRIASPAPGIDAWLCGLEVLPAELAELRATLSPEEHERAGRFGTTFLRNRWIAGRAALRRVLGETLGVAPAAVVLRRGRRGRPELAQSSARIDFNVSHTRDVALMAVARDFPGGVRIGVDIEHRDREVGVERLARKFLTPREQETLGVLAPDPRRQRFLRYWTCKEAMSKATGDGLIAPFRRLDVDLTDAPRLRAGPPPYEPPDWSLYFAEVPPEWFATIALWRTSA